MQINWDILNQLPNIGETFQRSYQQGQERGRVAARDRLLANYAANPTADALSGLAAVDPQAFVSLSRHERDRSDFAREGRGRAAYAGYLRQHEADLQGRGGPAFGGGVLSGGPAAFLNRPMERPDLQMSGAGQPNALAPSQAQDALAPPQPSGPVQPSGVSDEGSEIVVTGRKRAGTIPPRERYSLADVAFESPEMADRLSGQLATIDKAHYAGLQEYFGAIGAVATRARELDVADRPAFINANRDYLRAYGITDEDIDGFDDGDASLDGLIRLSMGVKDSLANSRADRNTASIIEDRDGRRALVARGQDMTDARGRYGISVASADRQRGQNLSSADRRRAQDIGATTARRGQDMTDRRVRETGGRRASAGSNGAPAAPATVPKVGEVRQGYRYKGGDPRQPASWEKVK